MVKFPFTQMSSFVHLHNHTHYSLLKSVITPKDLIKKAKECGCNSVAITDVNAMYGAIEFFQEAKKEDINPIIGCELNVKEGYKGKSRDAKFGHMVLLAENQQGYLNLLELSTLAFLRESDNHEEVHVTFEELKRHNEGLIILSGSVEGLIPQLILGKHKKELDAMLKEIASWKKDGFYFELQHHPQKEGQNELNSALTDLAKEHKIGLVATNDVHYLDTEDRDAQETMLCIEQNISVEEEERFTMKDSEYDFKTPEEMKKLFSDHPEAIANTQKIADRCKVDFEFGTYDMPEFPLPKGTTSYEYFKKLCLEGLLEKYSIKLSLEDYDEEKLDKLNEDEKKIVERLKYEIEIIHKMGFETYFLIVWDFVKYAKDNGILVGPGRGSAAGAIVSYCLGITNLDPLKYDLLFERFLNPERAEMPDIDMDFQDNRRDEVIEYVFNKYGHDHVAQISTFGTLAARAAVKDVGRAMGVPFLEMNNLAKLIPARPGIKLQETLDAENSDIALAKKSSPLYEDIVNTALKLEGLVRHISVHACAVVISNKKLTNYTALQHPPKDQNTIISQYSAKPLGALGLLKMDFLGLRNLTIINDTLELIKKHHNNKEIDINNVPLDDEETFDIFAKGITTGVFQFESGGMRRYLKELKPTELEDIIAMSALYRPGPMDWIPHYIKGKHGEIEIKYIHPSLEPYLKPTYGVAVYQEQVMEIAQAFSGMSLGEAYILLKGIAKKKPAIVQKLKQKFISGAVESKGHSKNLALDIFEKVIEPFAGYGFNKSHAACYAFIAYQTAYLKAHYPTEFMAALLSIDADDIDRVTLEVEECRANGIVILPPDVNASNLSFSIEGDRKIRFGLSAIKGLGSNTIDKILEVRKEGTFESLEDMMSRLDSKVMNKKSIEALAKSGALDSLGERNQILENLAIIQDYIKKQEKQLESINENQASLFEVDENEATQVQALDLGQVIPASQIQKLMWEKELLGVYLTSHPLEGMGEYLQSKTKLIKDIDDKTVDSVITVGGLISNHKVIRTRKGDFMSIVELEDLTDKIELTLFPETHKKYLNQWKNGDFIFAKGKVQSRNNVYQMIINSMEVKNFDDLKKMASRYKNAAFKEEIEKGVQQKNAKAEKKTDNEVFSIKLHPDIQENDIVDLRDILKNHPGNTHVELCYPDHKCIPIPYKVEISAGLKNELIAWYRESKKTKTT